MLQLAFMLADTSNIPSCCYSHGSLLRKQLAFMLGRQQIFLTLEDKDCANSEDLSDIMSNVHLNTNFLALGREVGVVWVWSMLCLCCCCLVGYPGAKGA